MRVFNRQLLCFAIATAMAATVGYADDTKKGRDWTDYLARQDRVHAIEQRIWKTEPHRRDTPVREKNISDDEIREIENVIHDIFPHALVNISTVVTGCPCEEGPKCKDQVWLTA